MKKFLSCFIIGFSILLASVCIYFACTFLRKNTDVQGAEMVASTDDAVSSKIFVGDGATYVFENGTISSGQAKYGGGVHVEKGGTFEFRGGKITKNEADSRGGGVYVDGGTFIMSGGEISGNNGATAGGGVYIDSGTFELSGGKIINNTDIFMGGGVYSLFSTFTMSGGEISGNGASWEGNGVVVEYGKFTLKGGTIKDVVYVTAGTFEYAGGSVTWIKLDASNPWTTFIISREPSTELNINYYNASGVTDLKIAKLEGISTMNLSKIKLTNSKHANAQLSIQTIDGERWIVMNIPSTALSDVPSENYDKKTEQASADEIKIFNGKKHKKYVNDYYVENKKTTIKNGKKSRL